MPNMLLADTLKWILIAIGGVIVLTAIMYGVNRHFRIAHDFSLLGGGFLMAIAIGCVFLGIFLELGAIGYAFFGVAALLVIVTLIYDCRRLGGLGVLALIFQLLFSIGSICIVLEFFTKGYTNYSREDRIVRRERDRRGYNDRDNYRY